jgi:8-oxo-dGTP pyrophosphatase MutT (NUDIX family)
MTKDERTSRQVAALPVRVGDSGGVEILLVTSRGTKRWIIPKGWPMDGKADWEAAAIEAREEAGAVGEIDPEPLGVFSYFKRRARRFDLIDVTVYRLLVTGQLPRWLEQQQRIARWMTPAEAAKLVQEPGLATIIIDC